eukprot:scaffold8232_cov67-Attheya_sp.AAC.1
MENRTLGSVLHILERKLFKNGVGTDYVLAEQQIHTESFHGGPAEDGINRDAITESERQEDGLLVVQVRGMVTDDCSQLAFQVGAGIIWVADGAGQHDRLKGIGSIAFDIIGDTIWVFTHDKVVEGFVASIASCTTISKDLEGGLIAG